MGEAVGRRYESVVIFNPKLGEAQLKDEIRKVEGLITNNKGKINSVDTWGRKEMSYLMKKEKFGYYVCFNYETDNHQVPNALASILRITEAVQKFQTHMVSGKKRKFKGMIRKSDSGSDFFDDSPESFE